MVLVVAASQVIIWQALTSLDSGSRNYNIQRIYLFYYATIAYHVGLNAVLRWPLATANDLEKKTFLVSHSSSCRHVITLTNRPTFSLATLNW